MKISSFPRRVIPMRGRRRFLVPHSRSFVNASLYRTVCCALLSLWMGASADARTVTIFVPATGLDERNEEFLTSTAAYLSREVDGYRFHVVRGNQNNWLADLRTRSAGLVFGDSAELVLLETQLESRPVAGIERYRGEARARSAGGVVFSLREQALSDAHALRGRSIGAVEGNPMLSWIAVNRELEDLGIDLERAASRIQRFPSDQEVVRAVLDRSVDTGIITSSVLESMAEAGHFRLEDVQVLSLVDDAANTAGAFPYLVTTRLYPEMRLMALRGVADDLTRRIAAALLSADAVPESGSDTLAQGWTVPHSCAEARVALRELRVPPFENFGRTRMTDMVREYMYWFVGAGAIFILLGLVTSYVLALNSSLRDEIQERNQAQRLLNTSIDRFEHVAHLSGDWIWETDTDERLIYTNDSLPDLLGWKPDEVLDKPFADLISGAEKEHMPDPRHFLHEAQAGVLERRIKMVTADGRVAVHACKVAPIRDSKTGVVTGYRGVHRDVTADTGMVTFE